MTGRALLIGTACVIGMGVAGLAQRTDESSDTATDEVESDETSSDEDFATPSPTEEDSLGEDFSESIPPPSAARTQLNGALSPLKPGERTGDARAEAPSKLDAIPSETGRNLWRIGPIFGAGVTYDDNIFISNSNRVSDVIWSLRAGLALEVGDFRQLQDNFLIARWEGLGLIYTKNPEQTAFNQDAGLLWQYRWEKLKARIESRYQYLTTPDRLLGTATPRQFILNAARFDYNLSDKTSVDTEFSQSTQLYESFLNQYEYRGKAGIGYQVLPKINLGVESIVGYLNVQESPGQIYEQVRLRTRYDLSGKLALKTSAGVEFREFSNDQPLRVNPVFGLGLEFQPFDGTFISLEGYRNIHGSAAAISQDYTATGLSLSFRQRFLQKVTANAEFGYENDSYFGTSAETGTNRSDNYFFIRSSLAYPLARCLAVQLFYEFQNNGSNETDNAFRNNRAGG